jgi:hypothetical protein
LITFARDIPTSLIKPYLEERARCLYARLDAASGRWRVIQAPARRRNDRQP